MEDGVDASVAPGDDFFRFANGAWLKATEIPAGKPSWGARQEISERTRQQVQHLLDDAKTAPRGSSARKVADFQAAYLDEAAIDAHGLAPVKPMLARIDAVNDKANLTRLLGSGVRADVDPMDWGVYTSSHIIGLATQPGRHGEKTYAAYLVQGGLGLPEREAYLGADSPLQLLRGRYTAAVAHVLSSLGESNAQARAAAVIALETEIARSHATREASDDDHNADTVWTRADFEREAPGMDWTAFFAAAGLSKQNTFVAWQPSALKGMAALVASQPVDVWKDYLRVRVIARYADVLPRKFTVAPITPEGPRAPRALETTQSAMTDAIARLYVERNFPPESKARVQAIVANVATAFMRRVEAATWMSPSTRAVALAKLKRMEFGVGYPDRWKSDPDVAVDAHDPVANLERVAARDYRRAVARLGKPVDQKEWAVAPQWPGAMLHFQRNAYNFAGALLQAPKFDPSASDATNYGAIGAIVGHEMSHFVDTLGADYEADGRYRRWWTAPDMSRYEVVTEPLVRQFTNYRPFPDLAVEGRKGLTENLADLGGLVAAFDAYRATLGRRANDAEFVRRQDRQFFIGYARAWRIKYRDEALRKQSATDHSPEMFRVSTVRNLDAWYQAFDVQPGQKLYLEPAARVRIW
jgi:putative endopeptidase